MPRDGITHLRIYCVCGQKMKVSEEMFGRPGKCIACRQKIRIPNPDEMPEGTEEVYLKDHPEFLRKVAASPVALSPDTPRESVGVESTEESASEVASDKGTPAPKKSARAAVIVPLDTLEAIRELCSLERKFSRQAKALDSDDDSNETALAEAQGYLARVQQARADLDEQLHQMLMEVAIELASTHEKIAQTQLAARVGEIDLGEFLETTLKLRSRRDRLERREYNLRGWLATTNPHMAGGYIDLPVSRVPEDGALVSIPSEQDNPESLINIHVSSLRNALRERSEAERKLSEIDKMREASELSKDELHDSREDAKAALHIADARISFARDRLKQLQKDYIGDTETFSAQLDSVRGRLQLGEIKRPEFDAAERALRRAKTDVAKARSVVERTLRANSAQDVPRPRGTFMDRLASSGGVVTDRGEMWTAWISAACLVIAILLPAVGNMSLVGAFREFSEIESPAKWIFIWPIVFAGAIAASTRLADRSLRGGVLTVFWITATLLAIHLIHEAQFGLDPFSAQFRTGVHLMLRPGIVLLGLGNLGLLATIFLCFAALRRQRLFAIGAVALTVFLSIGIGSDMGGYFVPTAIVAVDIEAVQSDGEHDEHRGTITVTNGGHRDMHLVPYPSEARGAYLFILQQWIGGSSWSEVGGQGAAHMKTRTIEPGGHVAIQISLVPGEYRFLLISKSLTTDAVHPFSVEKAAKQAPVPDLPPEPKNETQPENTGADLDEAAR